MVYLSVILATLAIVLWVPVAAALLCLWRRDKRHAEHLEQLDEGIARAFGRDTDERPRLHIVRGGRYLAAVTVGTMPGWWRHMANHVRDHPGAATVATIVASFAVAAPVLFPAAPPAKPPGAYAQAPEEVVPPTAPVRAPQPRTHPSAGPTPVAERVEERPGGSTPAPEPPAAERDDDTTEPRQEPAPDSDDPSPPPKPAGEGIPPAQEPRMPDDAVEDCAIRLGGLACVDVGVDV